MITRTVYPENPPRVEYALTDEGRTFVPVLQRLCDWGWEYDQRHGQTVQPCAARIDG